MCLVETPANGQARSRSATGRVRALRSCRRRASRAGSEERLRAAAVVAAEPSRPFARTALVVVVPGRALGLERTPGLALDSAMVRSQSASAASVGSMVRAPVAQRPVDDVGDVLALLVVQLGEVRADARLDAAHEQQFGNPRLSSPWNVAT